MIRFITHDEAQEHGIYNYGHPDWKIVIDQGALQDFPIERPEELEALQRGEEIKYILPRIGPLYGGDKSNGTWIRNTKLAELKNRLANFQSEEMDDMLAHGLVFGIDFNEEDLGIEYHEVIIPDLHMAQIAGDPLRITTSNVKIHMYRSSMPTLSPILDYSQRSGIHKDLILQAYGEVLEYGTHALDFEYRCAIKNISIPHIDVEVNSIYWKASDLQRATQEKLGFGGIVLSENNRYKNMELGTSFLSFDVDRKDLIPTLVNANHMENSIIGNPRFYNDCDMIIQDRKHGSSALPAQSKNVVIMGQHSCILTTNDNSQQLITSKDEPYIL